jgi:hypothetical protein
MTFWGNSAGDLLKAGTGQDSPRTVVRVGGPSVYPPPSPLPWPVEPPEPPADTPRPRWRRRVALAAAAVVVAAGVAIPSVLLISGGSSTPAAEMGYSVRLATGWQPSAKERATVTAYLGRRDADVRKVLTDQSGAVVRRDEAAFLRGVDTKSSKFRAHEREVFGSLRQLTFASWSYRANTGKPYPLYEVKWQPYAADDVVVLPVTLRYQIKGFDDGAIARDKIFTFVRRGETWSLAGDTDLTELLTINTYSDPWDVGAIAVARGKHSLVIGSQRDRNRLPSIARLEDRAIATVARRWPGKWPERVVVVVPRDARLIKTLFLGSLRSLDTVAAVAVPQYGITAASVSDLPDDPKAVSARVIVNPKYFSESSTSIHVLTHETTHVATFPVTHEGAPQWLIEGYAEYVSRPTNGLQRDFVKLARTKKLPDLLPTFQDWNSSYKGVLYDEAWLACRFIADRWGEKTLIQLYKKLGAVTSIAETLVAQDKVFASMLHTSYDKFGKDWNAYMRSFAADYY